MSMFSDIINEHNQVIAKLKDKHNQEIAELKTEIEKITKMYNALSTKPLEKSDYTSNIESDVMYALSYKYRDEYGIASRSEDRWIGFYTLDDAIDIIYIELKIIMKEDDKNRLVALIKQHFEEHCQISTYAIYSFIENNKMCDEEFLNEADINNSYGGISAYVLIK